MAHRAAGGRVRVVSQRLVSLERRHLGGAAPVARTARRAGGGDDHLAAGQPPGRRRCDNRAGAHRPAPLAHLRPARPRTGAADARRRRSPGGGTVTLGYRCVGSGMTIAAAYRHAVDGGGDAAFDTELGPRSRRHHDAPRRRGRARPSRSPSTSPTTAPARSPRHPATCRSRSSPTAVAARSTTPRPPAGTRALAEQRAWLDRFWARTDIAVEGDDAAQQAIRWNLFQMAQASAQIGGRGIAAKAVTGGGLRRPLLLGHRDLRGPAPRVHQPGRRPRPAPLPPPHASGGTPTGRSRCRSAGRCTRGGRSTARRPRRTTRPAPPSTTSTPTSPTRSTATSRPPATSSSSATRAPRCSSRWRGCSPTSASTTRPIRPRSTSTA